MPPTPATDPNAVSALGWTTKIPTGSQSHLHSSKRPRGIDFGSENDDDADGPVKPAKRLQHHPIQSGDSAFPPQPDANESDVDDGNDDAVIDNDDDNDDDDDDYMSMAIPDQESSIHESSLQRKARLRREAEARSRPKSKAEIQADEESRRNKSLNTALDASNKGFRMMAKMGFAAGDALGAQNSGGRKEPIAVDIKEGRAGIGLDAEKNKALRERFVQDEQTRRIKDEVNPTEYRDRMAREREHARLEKVWRAAMSIAAAFEEDDYQDKQVKRAAAPTQAEQAEYGRSPSERPIKDFDLLWRALIRERRQRERESRLRHDLSLTAGNESFDHDDSPKRHSHSLQEQELEEEEADDSELDEFLQLDVEDRLSQMVLWLRRAKKYCFWCKATYSDDRDLDENCPGTTEDDHE